MLYRLYMPLSSHSNARLVGFNRVSGDSDIADIIDNDLNGLNGLNHSNGPFLEGSAGPLPSGMKRFGRFGDHFFAVDGDQFPVVF